ncbi:MAG TPA: extracellular solute-binding protein [Candidatus Binatia bacterium]
MKKNFAYPPAALVLLSVLLLADNGWAQSDWKKDWENTLQAAKKEGQVTVYIYRYERMLEAFKKDYPDIKVVTVTGTGNQLGTRIVTERRAEKYIADIFSTGPNSAFNILYKGKALDPLKPAFILPEVKDESKWYGGRYNFIDPDGKYIFGYLANSSSAQLYYNSKLLQEKEFKSHWDLLNPKWKGKIVSLDPALTGLGQTMQFFYYHPELGPDFIKKLFGGMDVTYAREFRQMTDWLGQGKYAICIGCKDGDRAKHQGLPVESFETSLWKEGGAFSSGGGSLSLVNRAPHPNAAKVFVNWLLSRTGQIALQKLADPDDPPNSRRIDIPKDDVPIANRLVEGRRYLDVGRPEWQDMEPIFQLAREIAKTREAKQ